MTSETKNDNRAREQAQSQLESIQDMVKRLQHAEECDGGEECELTGPEIYAGINLFWEEGKSEVTAEDREEYHDTEKAREAINEAPLSVQVRSDWHNPGESSESTEYMILLCTGGPAVRIVGELGRFNEPDSARIEYQDWFTPWEEYRADDGGALLTYAQCFYFGE